MLFNRDLNRGCLVYMFSLRFSGSKFLVNLRRQFRVRKFSVHKFLQDLKSLYFVFKISKLQKGAKRPHCNFDFMNKIEVRSNTVFYQLGRLNNTRAQTF